MSAPLIVGEPEKGAWTEPKWELEYDAYAAYDLQNKRPATAPLIATFFGPGNDEDEERFGVA